MRKKEGNVKEKKKNGAVSKMNEKKEEQKPF